MTINIRGIQGTFILKYPRSEKNQARAKSRIITAIVRDVNNLPRFI